MVNYLRGLLPKNMIIVKTLMVRHRNIKLMVKRLYFYDYVHLLLTNNLIPYFIRFGIAGLMYVFCFRIIFGDISLYTKNFFFNSINKSRFFHQFSVLCD